MVIEALKAHRARQTAHRLQVGQTYVDQDLIFALSRGQRMTHEHTIWKAFKANLKAAKCPEIRIHDLRHSYASLLIAQGESPKYIQKQLGHSSVKMTFDFYGHLMPEVHREAPLRLEKQVFGTSG